jgi:hypothetical protein
MKVACLGWGSLIWELKDFKVKHKEWFQDGPYLPIEFTRISENGRATLIIDKEANPVQVLWNFVSANNLEEAVTLLSERESCSENMIGRIISREHYTDQLLVEVSEWAKTKKIEAVVWTGLSYSRKTGNKRPTFKEVLSNLNSLDGSALVEAKKYILNAPPQIRTLYRKRLETEFLLKS